MVYSKGGASIGFGRVGLSCPSIMLLFSMASWFEGGKACDSFAQLLSRREEPAALMIVASENCISSSESISSQLSVALLLLITFSRGEGQSNSFLCSSSRRLSSNASRRDALLLSSSRRCSRCCSSSAHSSRQSLDLDLDLCCSRVLLRYVAFCTAPGGSPASQFIWRGGHIEAYRSRARYINIRS